MVPNTIKKFQSLFSPCQNDFEKDFQFGITDKFLESFSEAGPQMLLTLTFLLMVSKTMQWVQVPKREHQFNLKQLRVG